MRLHHPSWTHAPALVLIVLLLTAFWQAWPLPDPAPVHFGSDGAPDRWGSPWEMPVILTLVTLVAIAISFAVDETWARAERRKRFNWFAPIDELLIAFLAAVALQYVAAVKEGPYLIEPSKRLPVLLMILAGATAIVLERMRPVRLTVSTPGPTDQESEETFDVGDIAGKAWAYWEVQNPRYTRWYVPIFGIGVVALGLTTWDEERWAAALALAAGLVILLAIAGGFRISINRQRLTVRGGLLGIPLLRLPLAEIEDARVEEFSPLADFGGYGIRRNREMTAFFLGGDRGVRLTTSGGKSYLLGSDSPGRLAAVLRAVKAAGRRL